MVDLVQVKYSNVQPREASLNHKKKKITRTLSNTYSNAHNPPLHHKSLFKSLSLYLHGSLYLISCLPSRMAYIQQEKYFRFNRIRVFWVNITSYPSLNPKCWDIHGSFGWNGTHKDFDIEQVCFFSLFSCLFLYMWGILCPHIAYPQPPFISQLNIREN